VPGQGDPAGPEGNAEGDRESETKHGILLDG
jgi:hypothetical protein